MNSDLSQTPSNGDLGGGGDPWDVAHGAWVSPKHTTASVLSLLLGWLGIDRFYMGRIVLGILKLITFGGGGIWWVVDMILVGSGKARDSSGSPLISFGNQDMPTEGAEQPRYGMVSQKHFVAVILEVLLGWLGVDRMYMGRVGLGILKLVVSLVTFGVGAAIWGIVDYILITSGKAIDGNGNPLIQYQ